MEDIISVENLLKIYKPNIIPANQPTRNPDTATTVEIMEIFKALNRRGRTIVTITHDTEIGSYPERAIQFRETKVLEDGGSKKTRLKKDRIW